MKGLEIKLFEQLNDLIYCGILTNDDVRSFILERAGDEISKQTRKMLQLEKAKPARNAKKVKTQEELADIRERRRIYSQSRKWVSRAYSMNNRALKKYHDDSKVDDIMLQEIMAAYNNKCAVCGSSENLCFDHIVPMYNGGKNSRDNLQILCRKCNMEKGVKPQEQFNITKGIS